MEEQKINEINSIINGFKDNYKCPKCGHEQLVPLLPYINFSKNPEYYALTKNLDIFKVKCEKCCNEELIQFDTLLVDEIHKYFLYFLTDKNSYNRFKYQITYFIETTLNKDDKYNLDDFKTRLVFTHNDLIEKMTIFELGLNDKIIEIIKSGFIEKGIIDINVYDQIYFDCMNNQNLQFVTFSSKTNTIEPLKYDVDFKFYNKIIDNIKGLDKQHHDYFEVIDQDWVKRTFTTKIE